MKRDGTDTPQTSAIAGTPDSSPGNGGESRFEHSRIDVDASAASTAAPKHRWYFLWIRGNRTFNVHSSRDCHRLSFQVGPLGFRWCW